ncbi:MFS transporter [Candidatus Pacearchaeota archaeon]|nr:MFS transporter [Candidatus Pacearchaeota archaeon]HLC73606.1 MFS transporter [Candidatus Nanoarchaeia archaeon]
MGESEDTIYSEKEESAYLKHSKEHALKTSMKEGSTQSIGVNMSSGFLTPMLLAIGGNSFHIGILNSLNGLTDPLGEIAGSKLMEKHSRKKLWINAKVLVILLQFPVLALLYLYWKGLFISFLPWIMIALWGIFIPFIYGAGYVSWLSWLGDLVPPGRKGEFFASRNKLVGFVGLVTLLAAGFLLDLFKTKGYVLLGFSVLFGLAIVFRLSSAHYTSKIFNPYFRVRKQSYFSFSSFLKRYDNYGKFSVFQAFFFFSIMLSAPFFAVRMLEDLHFSYITYTLVSLSSTVFYLLFTPLTGKFSDKYGNLKLIYLGSFLFPLIPLLWVVIENPLYLILIPGFISGLANASFIIGTTDFSYNSTSPQKRGFCFAYSALLIGFGTLVGSFIGGWIVEYSHISFINPMFFAFILSSAFMIFTALYFLPKLREDDKIRSEKRHFEIVHPIRAFNSVVIWLRQFSYWHVNILNNEDKR